jgi:hypothetical protein
MSSLPRIAIGVAASSLLALAAPALGPGRAAAADRIEPVRPVTGAAGGQAVPDVAAVSRGELTFFGCHKVESKDLTQTYCFWSNGKILWTFTSANGLYQFDLSRVPFAEKGKAP